MKVFSLLLSIILFPSPVQPQGQWGNWGRWSSCSRTCGGGITFQERKCLTKNCVGENKIHRSCNIQDCSNSGNFRQEQCAAYNSVPYHGMLYEWFPYSGVSDNPCSLNCMPKNEFFYDTFKEKVIDGTRCNDDTYNMCADGVCKKAGCDLILGSDAKEDKCRVCNGGGNNCRTIQNIYTGNKKGIGYVDILSIPPGATNIFIKEVTRSSNYLALKNSSHSYILNGNRNIKRPGKYQGPGTMIKFKRSRKEESIFALGPTTDLLYLSLLSLGGDISISYEYSVPKSQKITDKLIKYSWKTEQYGVCTRKCNGGEKSRKVYCVRSHDNVEVENSKCSSPLKPKKTKVCNQQPCPPRWFVGAWSPCSLSCGEGTQVRRVHCERKTPEGIEMLDEKRYCTGNKAITQRKCIVLEECPKWALRGWSKCSKTCGGGTRTRNVQCVEINNNVIGHDKCPEHNRPRDQEICNDNPCDVRWVSGDWGACRPSCGKGMRTRPVYCASSIEIKRRYPDYMCTSIAKPETTKSCSSPKSCPPMWYGSSWSKCTASCGKGIQMRNVFCGVKEKGTDYLKILSYDRCRYLPQLKTIQVCTIAPCHTQWIVSSWKPCSSKCGNGKRLRDVKCFADSEEDKTEKSCDAKKKPPTDDSCNWVECPSGTNSNFEKLKVTLGITQSTIQLITTQSPPITRNPPRTLESTRTASKSATTRTLPVRTTTATEITRKTTVLSKLIFPTRGTVDNSIEGTSMPAIIVRGPVNDGRLNEIENVMCANSNTLLINEAVVGSDIILPCEAKGNPKPDIFWLKGNLDVSVFGQRFQVLPNGYLKIIAVQEVDEDLYTCVANNVISRRSQPAYLLVTTLPYVDMTLGYTVKEGEIANIQCRASGKPRPIVQWYKDGNHLKVQRNDRMVVTTQAITIMSVQLADHGKYKCKATNKNGETTGYMMLDVLPDEKTRLHDIMNGNCKDNEHLENCDMAAKLENPNFCDKPYYQMVCCKTCRDKHKGRLGSL